MAKMTDEEINKIIEDYELATGLREPEREEAPKHEASKSKKKANTKSKAKAKGAAKVGLVTLASGALGAAIAGAGNLDVVRDVNTTSKEPAIVATVDSDIANEDPTLTDAITLRAQYSNNIETLKELQEKVDDENFHFVREGVKTKEGQGVIDFDKSLDNIISYYKVKADALDLMLADNVIDATELKDLYFMMSESEHEIRILAEIENYDQALKAVTDAKNHEEGTSVNKRTVDKIYTGKEDEKFDLFMTFGNETELQEWIDKIAKENSIEDVKLNCEAVEYEDETEKTKQEVTLYGEEVAQPKKQITPNVPVVPPVVPPVEPVDPPYIPPVDPDPVPTEEQGSTENPVVPVVTEEENEEPSEEEKEEQEAEEEEYSATEEEFGESNDAPVAQEEEFGDEATSYEETAYEEEFGYDESSETIYIYSDEAVEEEFGD